MQYRIQDTLPVSEQVCACADWLINDVPCGMQEEVASREGVVVWERVRAKQMGRECPRVKYLLWLLANT